MTAKHSLMTAIVLAGALSAPAFAQAPGAPKTPPPAPPAVPAMPLRGVPMPTSEILALAEEAATLVESHHGLIAESVEMSRAAALAAGTPFPGFEFVFQDRGRSAEEMRADRARLAEQRERDREGRAYDEAMRHVYESQWERAAERFNDVIALQGARVDAALYWKAYAQDRQGLRPDALATISTLTSDHPNSRYLQQARALEAEVRRNAGQPARPQDQADEDLKLMAIAALQNSAPEQAIPMLEKLLAGTATPKLKARALFVLAQSNSPRAREVLKGIAKGGSTPELQSRAISYLGMHGGPESRAVLAEIYGATADIDTKKRILRSLAMGGERDRILAAAQSEQNAELRREAVRQLGIHGGHAELSQLYAKETSLDIKKQILSAMAMGGNATRLTEIARTEKDPELRRTAIRSLGMTGGKAAGDTLVEVYASEKDAAVKKAVISALGMQNNATALVAIARKESDPALKREVVARLSHMNSKEATDYLLEILNK